MPSHEENERVAPSGNETHAPDSTLQFSPDAHGHSARRLAILDPRLTHGAYRFLDYLKDRRNRNGQAWPTIRQIAADLKSKPASLIAWIKILQECSYIAVERIGQNHNFRYTILCGDGHVVLPEWATRAERTRVAQKGNTKDSLVLPQKHGVLPKRVT